jgi:hypothetical protein
LTKCKSALYCLIEVRLKETLEKIHDLILDKMTNRKYGEIRITFEAGKIVSVKDTNSLDLKTISS